MSQLALRRSESPPESQCLSAESQPSTSTGTTQDSPTTTSYQTIDYHPPFAAAAASAGRGDTTPVSPLTITLTSAGRFLRKPAPSPLHTTTAVSPPSSASPRCSTFPSPSPAQDSFSSSPVPSVHSLVRDSLRRSPSPEEDHSFAGPSYRKGQFSPPVTPVYLNNNSPCLTPTSPAPNDLRTATLDRVSAVAAKPISPVASVQSPTMAGSATASPVDGVNGAPRTSSIDSVMSTISSRTQSQQRPQDTSADIETLVRAAGSPEGVIQYLLKEKHSQSQQNAQLWRLVDKQRAMILGLNKDLERALKDKEKYRKKLKDVMAVHDENLKRETLHPGSVVLPSAEIVEIPTERPAEVPASPSNLDSGSAKHSPINVTLAPYPITAAAQTTACASTAQEGLGPTDIVA
ncbi:hypothetical protein F4780DRAFT_125351 [Xylariomycetidae sp. FL0641]|nr:hypothetical protein F4780DRAFT_125351 [Xylariomycetidae sp. FL0641]